MTPTRIVFLGFAVSAAACFTQPIWSVDHVGTEVTVVSVSKVYHNGTTELTITAPEDGGE